jgi:glycyl-tRNA synthetase beta chain
MRELLVEIGCEELPPKELAHLSQVFAEALQKRLEAAEIACGDFVAYCTPRRLAVRGRVAARQPDRVVERRGPSVKAGRDAEGGPTAALLGFARSVGVAPEALEIVESDRGAFFVHRREEPGRLVAELLPGFVAEALDALPVPRPMRWGEGEQRFIRPVHWLVLMLDDEPVPARLFGVESGKASRGHRFHHPQPVPIGHARHYLDALREAKVLADPNERLARIRAGIEEITKPLGLHPKFDDPLLTELEALSEWPRAILCAFDPAFLRVPREVLESTMMRNQRFVPLMDREGRLSSHFVGIANLESRDPEVIRHGYERVIRPRFADAAFFWDQDLATPLVSLREGLGQVVYQQSLGTLADKSERVARLAESLARDVGDFPKRAREAAWLSRCDLLTRLVGEFPELQGTIGRRIAEAQGLERDIAEAIEDFYRPRHAGDAPPLRPLAIVLAIADRLDTLAGGFAAGLKPTGNKDPFALRRAAAGLALILADPAERTAKYVANVDLRRALAEAAALQPTAVKPDPEELYDFVLERLRADRLSRGTAPEVFAAVAALRPPVLLDLKRRIDAIEAFREDRRAEALIQANKRIRNILRKADERVEEAPAAERLTEEAEQALWQAVERIRQGAEEAILQGSYRSALQQLAELAGPLDRFFTEVLVMCEDETLRRNRLALLAAAERPFRAIAEFSLLPG